MSLALMSIEYMNEDQNVANEDNSWKLPSDNKLKDCFA